MTEAYAKALLAEKAKELREAAREVMRHETDALMHHNLASIICECEWVVNNYGGNEK